MPLYVRPIPKSFNLGNSPLINSVISSYGALGATVRPNLGYLFGGKFGLRALGAFVGSTKFDSISHVALSCVPSKVFKVVVRSIAINVAAIENFRHWLVKSRKNKAVNAVSSNYTILAKPYLEIAKLCFSWGHNETNGCPKPTSGVSNCSVKASHSAFVRDLVVRLKPWNVFPNFIHVQSPLVDARKKLHSNQYGNRLSGATLAMQENYSAH